MIELSGTCQLAERIYGSERLVPNYFREPLAHPFKTQRHGVGLLYKLKRVLLKRHGV
jgi:hypothetical protein